MTKIKVSEIFASLQGEGLYLGTPSIFLRTFGCNFTCGGFGMPRGQISQERYDVNPDNYKTYNDLPLVHTGCDSYPAWDPRFKKFSPLLDIEVIADEIEKLLPNGVFSKDFHLVVTGGEPLLGWQKQYPYLFSLLQNRLDLSHVTFETNGTQPLSKELEEYIETSDIHYTFSVSSKLPCSGEPWEKAIRPEVVLNYFYNADEIYFKWVVATEEDIKDVARAVEEYRNHSPIFANVPVYLMPVGGTTKLYFLNENEVAKFALENGYRYSPRLQINLYGNAWAT